jgi:thiosulfate/3-mercaptopyruvate sulfurtransferase
MKSRGQKLSVYGLAFFVLGFGLAPSLAESAAPDNGPGSALAIPQAELMQPEALLPLLKSAAADKPLVLQVGSHVLFTEAHIAGSEYVGPGSQPSGLQALRERVAKLPKDKTIVLYCGCCPWGRCPNMGPAFRLLRELGFTRAKALYLANNLGTDWVDKGYPVERGH